MKPTDAPDAKMNMPLELAYSADKRVSAGLTFEPSPTKSLILHALRKHLATIPQSSLPPRKLLSFISEAWNLALTAEEEIRQLEFCGVTKLRSMKDEAGSLLRTRCTVLGATGPASSVKKGRVDVDFNVKTRVAGDNNNVGDIGSLKLEIEAAASKVYGFGDENQDGISESQMKDILHKETQGKKSGLEFGKGVWRKAVRELTGRIF